MAWPRIKNSRSSALPGRHSRDDVQVSVTPAPDADPAPDSGQNTGISGTRHSVVDPQWAPIRYADSGIDDVSAEYEDTTDAVYEVTPPDDGIPILEGMVTTEVPADAEPPTADLELPRPEWNQPLAAPPRPAAEAEAEGPGPAGPGGYGGAGSPPMSGGSPGGRPPGPTEQVGVRDLPPDIQMRIWRWRVLIMIVVGVAFTIIANWAVGLTLAILAGIADTIYRSRTAAHVPTGGSLERAQRRTRRQLAGMQRGGYLTLDARPIPNSREVIDHLVIGPTGVYAIDSEKWHKNMPIRYRNGKQLWHGPDSKKQRLEHARWEAQQASDVLSAALGTEIVVRPAMAIYGPKVPWDIATIRDVDVFSGPALRKYLKRRARSRQQPRLSKEQVREIYETAGRVLPDVTPTRTVTPVG
jgi:Nuclease-related domain